MIDRKFNTHTVIKNADIDKYLSKEDANNLKALIERLRVSKACNSLNHKENYYYIVNTDEPYAEEVLQVILNGEKEKIQSEQEEKTNFNVITESPEKLAQYLFELTVDSLDKCDPWYLEDVLEYLNEKAGE